MHDSPNALFCAYFPSCQHAAKLLTVQVHGGEYGGPNVPEPVAAYLADEQAKDADALSRSFTEDGTVHDEGQDYHGRDSLRQWKQAADAEYRYVLQAIDVQTLGDLVTVRARVTGGFPGSPVELEHIFKLSGDKIASLEIRS